jgi:uncharacterized membrane protein YraQ (UPF0718 family)
LENPWFTFSLPDFSYAFLSVLLEGVPFILIGTLLSGIIDEFLPSRVMVRFLPGNAFLGISLSGAMGLVFPMCECGVVPVIRRLINKGLPVSNAIAYMLGAPIVNPIVLVSTYVAFRGQNPTEFMLMRLGVGYFVAVVTALAVHHLPQASLLRRGVFSNVTPANSTRGTERLLVRTGNALRVAVADFLDVMVFFVLGVMVSALFSTSLNQELIMPLALNDWIATFSLMVFAGILSLCSTSDAFIAATLISFPAVAKLAFLVFGPMFDLKLLVIYGAVFRKRFVAGLGAGLFLLIGMICVRLKILGL